MSDRGGRRSRSPPAPATQSPVWEARRLAATRPPACLWFSCLLSGRVRESSRGIRCRDGGRSGLAAVLLRIGLDLLDVVLCLGIRRHASIPLDRTWTSVVGGEGQFHVATEAIELLFQVASARIDVLSGVPRVV